MNQIRKQIETSALGPVAINDDSGGQSYRFDEQFLGFAGHFPNYPILPAVLQILLAQVVAEQLKGQELVLLSVERAKFSQQLRPGDQIDVKVTCREKSGELHCSSQLNRDGQLAASMTLVLSEGAS